MSSQTDVNEEMGMGLADISERSYDPEEIDVSVTDKH